MTDRRSRPRVARPARGNRAIGAGVLATTLVALLGAASGEVRAQAPPGFEIVNVASCEYSSPTPSNGRLGPTTVPSNPVTTVVVRDDCFDGVTAVLTVEPSRTVVPGEIVTWALEANTPFPTDVGRVHASLALDDGVDPPVAIDVEFDPPTSGAVPAHRAWWAPESRTVEWELVGLPSGTRPRFFARVPVSPELDRERTIVGRAAISVDGCLDDPAIDPVDVPVAPPSLAVVKRADRSTAVPGDAVVYTVDVTHGPLGDGADPVVLVDALPRGFRLLEGSVLVDEVAPPPSTVEATPGSVRFDLGRFEPGDTRRVRYATVVSPEARIGDAVNRAVAVGATSGGGEIRSAPATAAVRVFAGPFASDGTVAGRVFVDRDGDGIPDDGEAGAPGVYVFLEDGRGAVTDVRGRWHVDRVRPGLHAVRIDPATLPPGLHAADASAEAPGVAGSRFVEVRVGSLAVVDLPLGPAGADRCRVAADDRSVLVPRAALALDDGSLADSAALVLERAAQDLAGPAPARSAVVECEGAGASDLDALFRDRLADASPGTSTVEVDRFEPGPAGSPPSSTGAAPPADTDPLEDAVRTTPRSVAILRPASGARSARAGTAVEVVYPSDHRPVLRVNGHEIPEDRIGTRATLPRRGLTAARYVGVPLDPGRNRLTFTTVAPGAATAGEAVVESWIVTPDEAAELRLDVPGTRWIADGSTSGRLRVTEVDGAGVRTAGRTVVTLDIDGAIPSTPDRDPVTPGLQVRLDDGATEIRFAPRSTPGRARVRAIAGEFEADIEIPIAPGADRWTVLGVAEARAAGDGGVEGDGGAGPDVADPITDDGGRLAVYARGPLGRSLQMTARVDTDRDRDRDRLADPIEPDGRWPVHGDDAEPVEDAASSGRWFARVDGPRGFARWGDFDSRFDDVELLRYDRRMHGLSGRLDGQRFSFEGFGSESDQGSVRDLFEPDGTSGPFLLSAAPVVARSETVIVEVRQRLQPETVRSRRVLLRDLDYDVDPIAGTLLLRSPLSPYDAELNPVRLVVLYESRGSRQQVTAGGRASFRVGDRFEAGASTVYEERDGGDLSLHGVDLRWLPVAGTRIRAEVAASDDGDRRDTAYRLEISSRTRPELGWDVAWRDVPAGFDNPSLLAGPETGSRRGSARVVWEAGRYTRLRGEATFQDDRQTDVERTTASVDAEHDLGPVTWIAGLTHARTDGAATGRGDSTLMRTGLRGRWAERWTLEMIREQPLDGGDALGYPGRTRAGVGFRIRDGLRAFALQEWEDDGPTSTDRTAIGLEGRLTDRTRATHRWFADQGDDGRAIRSATAVETVLPVREGHALSLSASRVWTARGDAARDGTVLGTGYEIRGGRSLLAGRYEVRFGERETRHLATAGGALRLGNAWSVSVRERFFLTDPSGRAVDVSRRLEGRIGVAWRPPSGRWQALARLDHADGGGVSVSSSGVEPGVAREPGDASGPAGGGVDPGIGLSAGRVATVFDRATWSVALAAGVRVTARQRLSIAWVGRRVAEDLADGIPSTFTQRTSLHWSARVRERWTLGASVRRYEQDVSDLTTFAYGAQIGYRAIRDLWLVTGWNVAGRRDDRFPETDGTEEGPFVGIRIRFDEGSLSELFR